MRELKKETADALEAAALKLQAISKEAVSRKYTRKPGTRRTALQQALFEERRRSTARKYFQSLPAKKKTDGKTQTQTTSENTNPQGS